MLNKKLRVLLVEDNETHSHVVLRRLDKTARQTIAVTHVTTLGDAISQATESSFDAVLLDLSLPDSGLTETLPRVIEALPQMPIIVLTSLSDLDFASETVHQGADDYLVKTDIGGEILVRAIRYAVERKRNQSELAEYAAKLERSNQELQSFAHTIAHEIRSPLTVVACCLQLVEEDCEGRLEKDTRESIDDAKTSVRNMTGLVTELLEYAKIEQASGGFAAVDMNVVSR